MVNNTEVTSSVPQRNVEKAAKAENPFENIDGVTRYTFSNNGSLVEYNLYCRTKSSMDPKVIKWAFKLAERNVCTYYKQLKMGWQPKVKQRDLNKNWARYLVAENNEKKPVAYAMFRFDMDYGQSVLYCYEMQIEADCRRQGLGKHMMDCLERCAQHWQMEKIVLTVLKNNTDAMQFFKSIGYDVDTTSPEESEKPEYTILSKINK